MTFGYCKNCHWWTKRSENDTQNGYCDLATSDWGDADHPESLAIARDSEPHSAWLETSPDFGCVQWKERTENA